MLRRKRFWFGLVITVAFLAFFLVRTDFEEIGDAFSGADYALALAGIPLYFAGYWFRSFRWHLLLRPVKVIATARLYPIVIIGLMTNNIAPMRIGELVRAYLVGEREGVSKSAAFGTIALDRLFDGLTLVAILGVMVIVSGADPAVKSLGLGAAALFLAGAAVLVAMALSPTRVRGWINRLLRLLPEGLATRVDGLLDSFMAGLAGVRSPSILGLAGLASFISWILEASMYYVVGEAFHLGVGFDAYLVVVSAANLALSVFASPGGVGPFEVTTREVLVFFGVGSAAASAYAIALHALLLAPVIIVGALIIWSSRVTMSEILGIRSVPPPKVSPSGALE
jgi:uncharacterized protein (TIRG00374 family)